MSTMLKTAAMSLLSKTLQTFLYKYLLDVDVEGVEMPSFMDVDGHSGWGVRLCNVRLREGVELMTLPGKVKRKRRKRKEARDDSVEQREEEEASTNGVEATNESEKVHDSEKVNDSAAAAAAAVPLVSNGGDEATNDLNAKISEQLKMVQADYTSDGDSGASTPQKKSSSYSFVCFHRGASTAPAAKPPVTSLNATDVAKRLDAGSTEESSQVADDKKEAGSLKGEALEEASTQSLSDEEDEDTEEFIEVEKDMMLRLGNEGCIGVLDVRLVGKELHVSIEDAFLVIETCQKPDEPEEDRDAAGKAAETTKPEETKDTAAATAKKVDEEDIPVGDKILENSAIARALSAIPHLFLRDCRVRLVVRHFEEDEEEHDLGEVSEKDSVLEFGVEMLSVTSGEDFLAHCRGEDDDEPFSRELERHGSFATIDENSNNEFIFKRIRTGRGPEGGVWLKIYPPGKFQMERSMARAESDEKSCVWARDIWRANAQFCLFRCSGLDIRSRMFLGKQEEVKNEYFFYDEFAVDSMLVGVDYLAPAPPPLPPLEEEVDPVIAEAMKKRNEVNSYTTDENGIQSIRIPSLFHRAARGLQPTTCKTDHIPCETCSECWTLEGISSSTSCDHPLDSCMPLAGMVLHLSLNDPLEINIDRGGLDVLGQLHSLFVNKETVDEPAKPTEESEEESDAEVIVSSPSPRMCMPAARRKSKTGFDVTEAFPSYMQPEKIEVLGLHLAKIVVRIQMLRSNGVYDGGFKFCYLEAETQCITMDMQQLSSETNLQDIRFDVGGLSVVEHKGTEHKQLVSLGLPHPESSDSDSVHDKTSPRTPWPCSASLIMCIPPSSETLHFQSRERHALQVRFITLSSKEPKDRTQLNVQVGVSSVDMPYKIKDDLLTVLDECTKSVLGTPKVVEETSPAEGTNERVTTKKQETSLAKKNSLMKYQVRVESASLNVHPLVNLRLPPTVFCGEDSSVYGLFFETVLQRAEFAHGEREPAVSCRRSSLSRLATLPETIRLRILLFVDDLNPLEVALGLKHEPNSYLRFRSVNKGIVKAARRHFKLKRKKSKPRITSNRRQEMISELLSMDDDDLQDLWSLHKNSQRRPKGI